MFKGFYSGVGILIFSIFIAFSQEAPKATVQLLDLEGVGSYLADGEGMSLYLFLKDSENESACYDRCAEAWPPLLAEGELTAGPGVAASLLATIDRSDGTQQVAYNGLPLYYFARDAEPGDFNGQGVGEAWYLISPYGVAIEIESRDEASEEEQEAEKPAMEMDHMVFGALVGEGRQVFAQNCAGCHGPEGRGGQGIALVGHEKLANTSTVLRQIISGSRFMPRFGATLTDREIAAVATFIRNSWGNDFGPVTEQEVKLAR